MTVEISRHSAYWPEVADRFLDHHLPGIGGASSELRNAIAAVNSNFNQGLIRVVRIQGESGAGKNHVARVISGHRYWQNAGGDAVVDAPLETFTAGLEEISVQAIPDSLIESELFGYQKGAFSGADKPRAGLLSGPASDVLLDEIGDASPLMQAKLLGVIETRRFRKLGASPDQMEETQARFLFATHRDLAAMIAAGSFREDLFWRASEIVIEVPPLRVQWENLPSLIDYQLLSLLPTAMYASDEAAALRGAVPTLRDDDLAWAMEYSWPGNLRQLRHTLVRWLAASGRVPLKRLAMDAEPLAATAGHSTDGQQRMGHPRDAIGDRLDRALAKGQAIARNLGELSDHLRRDCEKAVVEWYDQRRPTAQQIVALFPEMKRSSVASKLSTWRNRG